MIIIITYIPTLDTQILFFFFNLGQMWINYSPFTHYLKEKHKKIRKKLQLYLLCPLKYPILNPCWAWFDIHYIFFTQLPSSKPTPITSINGIPKTATPTPTWKRLAAPLQYVSMRSLMNQRRGTSSGTSFSTRETLMAKDVWTSPCRRLWATCALKGSIPWNGVVPYRWTLATVPQKGT